MATSSSAAGTKVIGSACRAFSVQRSAFGVRRSEFRVPGCAVEASPLRALSMRWKPMVRLTAWITGQGLCADGDQSVQFQWTTLSQQFS